MGRDVLSTDSYEPSQAVVRSRIVNKNAHRLAVLFPPWHGGGLFQRMLVLRLAFSGWAVMDNTFHDEILKAATAQVLASFVSIQKTVTTELSKAMEQSAYKQVHLVGISLGNAALALTASTLPDFTGATMVTPAASLAYCTWNGIRTQHIRASLTAQGVTEHDLEHAWHLLAPREHAQHFRGKPVNLVISTTDEIIPTHSQEEFAEALNQSGALTTIKRTSLGHNASIAHFCINGTR